MASRVTRIHKPNVVAERRGMLGDLRREVDPGARVANVREHPLRWIWSESDAFARFGGRTGCRSHAGHARLDDRKWTGAAGRCPALRLTGDAAATDPVCRLSAHHDRVVSARESAQTDEFVYRTMKRPLRV